MIPDNQFAEDVEDELDMLIEEERRERSPPPKLLVDSKDLEDPEEISLRAAWARAPRPAPAPIPAVRLTPTTELTDAGAVLGYLHRLGGRP